jgi:phage portal protein BeeE
MSDDALRRPLPPSVFARLADATRYVITGVSPDTWFGPLQPLAPMAPPEVKGRQFDYPFGANLNYIPRAEDGISFAELRGLADALPLLRAVIETRKDQIAAQSYAVRARARADSPDASKSIDAVASFLVRPDRRHSFADWLRMLVEEMLVIDAATIYPRFNRGGSLYSLDIIDGATIKPLIGEDGRSPEPPDPAYQQILKGVPAADFSADELLYLPRNVRSHRLYGMSPVEQIALTVNIALRRDASTLDYYRAGSSPDAFATLPKEWTADQIRSFQDYFDALMSGNLARRRQTKFMPADFKLIEARQPPLKDQYDEWLARIICYAFSVPVSPFVSQVNRATGETMRQQATQEGLVPLKAWVKNALDHVIQECMNEPGLEFVWVGDDAVDPLEQAQTLNILVGAGIKTRDEARADLGLAPAGGSALGKAPTADGNTPTGLRKFNPHHDGRGQFATADGAVATVGSPARKPQPTGVQVASNDVVRSDGGGPRAGVQVAQIIEPEPPPPPPEPPENPRAGQGAEPTLGGTVAEAVAPNGALPGVADKLGDPRTMPASDDPNLTARAYVVKAYNGQSPTSLTPLGETGGFVVKMPDGTFITFRPAGQASEKTKASTTSVDINGPAINSLNGGVRLKLKFPRK